MVPPGRLREEVSQSAGRLHPGALNNTRTRLGRRCPKRGRRLQPVGYHKTIIEAVPEMAELATLVAVTVTLVRGRPVGAVYNPVREIEPTAGEMLHKTSVLLEPVTTAWNCCVAPNLTNMFVGETETVTGCVAVTVTVALAVLVDSATLTAVSVVD